jgi:hypothetical protein
LCLWFVLALASCAWAAAENEFTAGGQPTEKRILVLKQQADLSSILAQCARHHVRMAKRHRLVMEELRRVTAKSQKPVIETLDSLQQNGSVRSFRSFIVMNAVAVEGSAAAFSFLADHPAVADIEPDETLELIGGETRSSYLDDPGTSAGLAAIRAPDVWALGITGAGVLLAHFDTGVNASHPALSGKWRGSLGYPASQCWLDLYGTAASPTDVDGHGTNIMSIMCGAAPGDTVGVAWNANYVSVRLNFTSGATLSSSALTAFDWIIDPDGDPGTFNDVPRLLSNSWGIVPSEVTPCDTFFYRVIDNCEAAGVAVFWAAGNEGNMGASTIRMPANRAASDVNAFAVGAYDNATDSIWSTSSRGPSPCTTDPEWRIKPELVAPGHNVRAATLGTAYSNVTGTSFSVASVVGTAALMLEANPELAPDSLKRILLLTAVDKGVPGEDNTCGWGHVDALCAVMGSLGGVGWIAGRVTDMFGNPLNATLGVITQPQHTLTDSSGFFQLAMPAGMSFTLQVTAPTFSAWQQAQILVPRTTQQLDITLQPAPTSGTLTGRVTSCRGQAAVGARVSVPNSGAESVYADGEGRFGIVLPSGTWSVTSSDGYCSDGQVDNVQILAGGNTDIEIVLPVNPAYICGDPDSFGYRICDNNDPSGPPSEWVEIAAQSGGNGVIYSIGDDASLPIALPFTARFYGNSYDRIFVNSNGNVSFGGSFTEYNNTVLPRRVRPAIFVFWDDLNDIYSGQICGTYVPARGAFVVEWSHVARHDGQGTETFELVLVDPALSPTATGDCAIEMRYGQPSVTTSCTVGLDGVIGNRYLQYVYNGSYDVHASPLGAGLALRLATTATSDGAPQLRVVNPAGIVQIAAGQVLDTAFIVQNMGTAPLAYGITRPQDAGTWTYSYTNSRDAGGPVYSFMDISAIGHNLGLARDDTTSDPLPLPWFFGFYGRYFGRMAVSSNGYVSFTSCSYEWTWNPSRLNVASDPFDIVAPYWTDLDITRGGAILNYYDASHERYIVQWNQIRRYSGGGPNTFQTILYHDGSIEIVYATMSSPLNNACVGIKGRGGSENVQLAYNQTFIQNNMLVRFTRPDTSGLQCELRDNQQGIIPAASSARVGIRLRNTGRTFCAQTWPLALTSSDPQNASVTVTVGQQNLPDPAALHLLAQARPQGVLLVWNRVNAPRYCVYSGQPLDSMLTHFEASVTDTFVLLPYGTTKRRRFEVRFCDHTLFAPPIVMPGSDVPAADGEK